MTEPLVLDNDTTHVYTGADDATWTPVFSMAPAEVLEQALDLLGIPHAEA